MNPIQFEALLVKAENGYIRAILEPYCLEWIAEDVLDVEELPPPEGLIEGSAIAARVTLKPAARMTRITPSAAYRPHLWRKRLPFALATRTEVIFDDQPAMKRAEQKFFAARGLQDGLS